MRAQQDREKLFALELRWAVPGEWWPEQSHNLLQVQGGAVPPPGLAHMNLLKSPCTDGAAIHKC